MVRINVQLLVWAAVISDAVAFVTQPSPLKENILRRGEQVYSCKCYEGDPCWPAAEDWQGLNDTVGGALTAVVPANAVCHASFEGTPTYDAEACATVQANLALQTWWVDQKIETMWTYWSNNTCLATASKNSTCTLGFSPEYVIMAEEKDQIKAGVDFARDNNLRLVIRNTGHDFMGRSNAFGALAINTHSFKDVAFTEEYEGPGDWTGSAVTVGAGTQLRELYRLANEQSPPRLVMGGECPTVGIAGGYIQGGGHGILGSWYGMAADNALSFDVITAEGEYVTADAEQNLDLFWALRGGGPASFAVIVSLTLKTFPDIRAAGTILDINSTHTNDTELLWKAVEIFHGKANDYTDNGFFVYYELLGAGLHIQPFVAPGFDAEGLLEVLKPLFDELDAAGVPYSTVTKEFSSVFDLYIDMFEDEGGNANMYVGGRIFTRDDVEERNAEIIASYKVATAPAPGYFGGIVGHIVGPGHNETDTNNAVNPVWRKASSFSISMVNVGQELTWEQRLEAEDILTNVIGKAMREASPHGGAYVNEGDLNEPDWQDAYWGENYSRLLEIRKKWDPNGVFYARTTPGTEDWEVIDYNTRLCKRLA